MLEVIRHEVCQKKSWFHENDFVNHVALASSFPGAIAINLAFIQGKKLRGFSGAFSGALGAILPAYFAIMGVILFFLPFFQSPWVQKFLLGASAGVAALIIKSAFSFAKQVGKDFFSLSLSLLGFSILLFFPVIPLFLILGMALIRWFLPRKQEKKP